MKIAKSNLGAHPFDPRRSTFGHYMVMVIRSVASHRWARQLRRITTTTIDDPEAPITLRYDATMDAEIDAMTTLRSWSDRDPEMAEALVQHEGYVYPAAATSGLAMEELRTTKRSLVRALRS